MTLSPRLSRALALAILGALVLGAGPILGGPVERWRANAAAIGEAEDLLQRTQDKVATQNGRLAEAGGRPVGVAAATREEALGLLSARITAAVPDGRLRLDRLETLPEDPAEPLRLRVSIGFSATTEGLAAFLGELERRAPFLRAVALDLGDAGLPAADGPTQVLAGQGSFEALMIPAGAPT